MLSPYIFPVSNWSIIVAAGKSERFGDALPKQFQKICGKPLLSWTIEKLEQASSIDKIVVVVAEEYQLLTTQSVVDPCRFHKVAKVVSGGDTRQESVYNGLKALPESAGLVAIHDGVRPLVNSEDIDKVVHLAEENSAAILAVPVSDTVKKVKGARIETTLNREEIWLAQTPQVFEYNLIFEAHRKLAEGKPGSKAPTDDAGLVEQMGVKVTIVEPSSLNLKVTTPDDLSYVESVLQGVTHG